MRKRKITKSAYRVGYASPPRSTQFAPGKSGNPKGRPKGSRSLGSVLNEILRQKVTVTEGGKRRKIPTLDVVLRRLTNDAMQSDPRAIKLLLSLLERYAESAVPGKEADRLSAEDEEILERYLSSKSAGGSDDER